MTLEEEFEASRLWLRADALSHAREAIEEQRWSDPQSQERILGVLDEMGKEAQEAWDSFCREQGIGTEL